MLAKIGVFIGCGIAAVVVQGCSPSSKQDTGPESQRAAAVLDESGGTVAHDSGAAIDVPAGALPAGVEISIEDVAPPAATSVGATPLGRAFILGPEGQTFAEPVTITVPYDPALVPSGVDPQRLVVRIAPQGTTNFETLATETDTEHAVLRAQTTHFSIVVPAAPTPDALAVATDLVLPTGTVGAFYEAVLAATGGTPEYTWTMTGGALPPGLTLDAGKIVGTPDVAGGYLIVVRVADAAGDAVTADFHLTIEEAVVLPHPVPEVRMVMPSQVLVGSGDTTIQVLGAQFVTGSEVVIDGTALAATLVGAGGTLEATVPASYFATSGARAIGVRNPAPGGGDSAATVTLSVVAANPVPVITSVVPSSLTVGQTGVTFAITGSSFVSGCKVVWDGLGITATYVSDTELTASFTSDMVATVGTHKLQVENPGPGGGMSLSFLIVVSAGNPEPYVTGLSPATVAVSTSEQLVTISGGNFIDESEVVANGVTLTPVTVSDTSIAVYLPVSLVDSARDVDLRVVNPAPGGGGSGTLTLLVREPNPAPTLASISPTEALVVAKDVYVTLSGSAFVAGCAVYWDSTALTVTGVPTDAALVVAVPSSLLESAGTHTITVVNPAPGGGTSTGKAFTVNNRLPVITGVSPAALAVGAGDTQILVSGSYFASGSEVLLNGTPLATTFATAGLFATVPASSLTSATTLSIGVRNPAPGGGDSDRPWSLPVQSANPTPVIAKVTPSKLAAEASAVTLVIEGTSFIAGCQVRWDMTALTVGDVKATSVTASFPPGLVATLGTHTVVVTNPAPGGGDSNAADVVVVQPSPAPHLTALVPEAIAEGSLATEILIFGSGFIEASEVVIGGETFLPNAGSSDSLTVTVPASLLASATTLSVTVTNPGPGGGTSEALTLRVAPANPVPTVSTLSPNSVLAGATATTVTITGSNFVEGALAYVGAQVLSSTFVSATELSATVPASLLVEAGSLSLTVRNPIPGGGTSTSAVTLTVVAPNPVPTVVAIDPNTVLVGTTPITLDITGTSFLEGGHALIDGNALVTTVTSATAATATVPATYLGEAGTHVIRFANPSPGGGTSTSSATLTVGAVNPVPAITSVSPSRIAQYAAATPISIYGTGFISGSEVHCAGQVLTSMLAGDHLTATVPASLLTAEGTLSLTVVNAAPGGGTSNAVDLTVAASTTPGPTVLSVQPPSWPQSSGDVSLVITGASFRAGDIVRFNNHELVTTVVSATELHAVLLAEQATTQGLFQLVVVSTDEQTSQSFLYEITAPGNPRPAISYINPWEIVQGSGATVIRVFGASFMEGTELYLGGLGGELLPTTFDGTSLTATLPAEYLASEGELPFAVRNPTPGGGYSEMVSIRVMPQIPRCSYPNVKPYSVQVGAGDTPVFVNCAAFNALPGAVVRANGTALPSSLDRWGYAQGLVRVVLPASMLTAEGSIALTVQNPGTAESEAATLQVTSYTGNGVPVITAISPDTVAQGATDTLLTITASGFVANAKVLGETITIVSPTTATVTLPASRFALAGALPIQIINPEYTGVYSDYGQNASNTVTLTVTGTNPPAAITAVTPAQAGVGTWALPLTLTGTTLAHASRFAATDGTDTFDLGLCDYDAAGCHVLAPIAMLSHVGTWTVSATNPTPGGGSGATATLAVVNGNPTPVVHSTADGASHLWRNGAAQSIWFTATGIIPATILVDAATGTPLSIYSNVNNAATREWSVGAQLPASLIMSADPVVELRLENPGPGGGASELIEIPTYDLPHLTALSVTEVAMGAPDLTLTITGEHLTPPPGFTPSVTGSTGQTPTTVGDTSWTVVIPSFMFQYPRTVEVQVVFTSGFESQTSNILSFAVVGNYPAPTLTSISPTTVSQYAGETTITMRGTGFTPMTQAFAGTEPLLTSFSSTTAVTAKVPHALLTTAGTLSLTVTNPTPGGGTSGAKTLTISPTTLGVPHITEVSPPSWPAGGAERQIKVFGDNLVLAYDQVLLNDIPLATHGSYEMTGPSTWRYFLAAILPSTLGLAAGTYPLVVRHEDGQVSAPIDFEISVAGNPMPYALRVDPAVITRGSPDTSITVYGGNFVEGSTLVLDGTALETFGPMSGPDDSLYATIPAPALVDAGTLTLEVVNDAPGGGTSNPLFIDVVIENLPVAGVYGGTSSALVGSHDLPVLLMSGAHMILPGARVLANGTPLESWMAASEWNIGGANSYIHAVIPASMLASPTTIALAIKNPGGTTGSATNLQVTQEGGAMPSITALSPPSVAQGAGDTTLVISGTGLLYGGMVFDQYQTGTSETSLSVTVPAKLLRTAGQLPVVVVSADGMSASDTLYLEVTGTNPTAAITGLSATELGVGTWVPPLDISGTGLLPSTVVSATQGTTTLNLGRCEIVGTNCRVLVPIAMTLVPGTWTVRTTNPEPGGGAGATATLSVVTGNPTPIIDPLYPMSIYRGYGDQTVSLVARGVTVGTTLVETTTGTTLTISDVTMPDPTRRDQYMSVLLPGALSASAGTLSFRMNNPGPGGGDSNTYTQEVPPLAHLSGVSPTSIKVKTTVTLTITGTDLTVPTGDGASAYVRVGSFTTLTPLTTSATEWTVSVPSTAYDISYAHDIPVSVRISTQLTESNTVTISVVP